MKVPLLDLKKQFQHMKDEIMAVTEEVMDSQQFILGPRVKELEQKIASYCRCNYAVGVSSGSDALLISLMAAGIGPGDFVMTSPYTFFATAGSITRLGATPIFVDIDEHTYNMDPWMLKKTIAALSNSQRSRLKAIMPVHLFGQCAEMDAILQIARDNNLNVIEDAAQAIGSEYQFSDGTVKRAGSMGEYGCFSFFPSKNLGAFGDGGMVTTNLQDVYERLRIIRTHGARPKYFHKVIGGNFRLDALQAAILSVKLKYLDEWTKKRNENANLYKALFKKRELEDFVALPLEREKRHIYNQFVIKLREKRDELKQFLNDRGVGCEIYYPVPLHMQDCFRYLNYEAVDFPVSAQAASKSLALPIYPELTEDQISYVVDTIEEFLERK
ncbi:MAG: DegT/DnrJ/EryC1/StrS family aminotransferase [Desulfobacteraceae bacterium]|jgi:dTDP-4-amino-4,6-dideoxygalactose transaminase